MSNRVIAVGTGAALGAWLRWCLGLLLNSVFPTIPLCTPCANLMGDYRMGMTMSLLVRVESLPAVGVVRNEGRTNG